MRLSSCSILQKLNSDFEFPRYFRSFASIIVISTRLSDFKVTLFEFATAVIVFLLYDYYFFGKLTHSLTIKFKTQRLYRWSGSYNFERSNYLQ